MKLIKEEIQFIDNYLIKNEVKYWDVRLELLDHIVSAVEDRIENKGISFNEALLQVHAGFGNQVHTLGINSKKQLEVGLYQNNIGFKKFTFRKQKDIALQNRKHYWKTFPDYLTSLKFILELLALIGVVYTVFQFHVKAALILTLLIVLTPAVIKLMYLIFDRSNWKSLNMQMMASLNVLFISLNYFFIAPFKHFNEPDNITGYLFYIVCYFLMFPFLRHSLNLFIRKQKTYKTRYKLMYS